MKKMHKSKTVWTNVILFLLLFVPELDHAFFEALGLDEKITVTIVALLTKALVVLNILFRLNTKEKIQYPV